MFEIVCLLLVLSFSTVDVKAAEDCSANALDLKEGNDYCCTDQQPCGPGDGDCDTDQGCAGNLLCGVNNCAWCEGKLDCDDCCYHAHVLNCFASTKFTYVAAQVMLVFFLIVFVGHIGIAVSKCWKLQTILAGCMQPLVSARQTMFKWIFRRTLAGENLGISKLAVLNRSRHAFTAFRYLSPLTMILLIPGAWHVWISLVSERERSLREQLVQSEFIPLIIFTSLSAYFSWLPHHITPRSLDAANAVCALFWIWKAFMLVDGQGINSFNYHQAWILPCRAFQGIIFGNASLTSLFHVIWVVFDIYTYDSMMSSNPQGCQDPHGCQDLLYYGLRQISLGLCSAGVAWAFELSTWAEVKATWAAEQSTAAYSQLSSQLSGVLSGMFDAVINLDASLHITGGGDQNGVAKLQSLLMCHSEILHRQFVDFVCLEDQQRFASYMRDREEQILGSGELVTMHPQSFHLHLKDEYGLRLPVQLFCSTFLDGNGAPMYLLCIRDDMDAATGDILSLQRQRAVGIDVGVSQQRQRMVLQQRRESEYGRATASAQSAVRPSVLGRILEPSVFGDTNYAEFNTNGDANSSTASQNSSGINVMSESRHSGTIDASESNGSEVGWARSNADFSVTPLKSICGLVQEGMQRINADDPWRPRMFRCCPFHLSLWSLNSGVRHLKHSPCNSLFKTFGAKQCVKCSLLADAHEEACGSCGGVLRGPGWQRFDIPRSSVSENAPSSSSTEYIQPSSSSLQPPPSDPATGLHIAL